MPKRVDRNPQFQCLFFFYLFIYFWLRWVFIAAGAFL